MINNKLGLKIVRTNQGYVDLLEVYGGQEWTRNVRDIREDLKNIDNLHNNSVLMLTCIDGGHLLTIASLIGGRITDYISAWIYIPSGLLISGKNLTEIIEVTKKEILSIERDDALLKRKFEETYEVAPAKRTSRHSESNQYAYRYYNDLYSLKELLDDIHQPYYQRYKSIFLIDKSSQLRCSVGDDLSEQRLLKSILAPVPKNVDGFVPHIEGKVFDSPKFFSEGEKIEITWRKDGYKSITTCTEVIADGFKYTEPAEDQYKRLIPYKAIKVVDERGYQIKEYDLTINNCNVYPGGEVPVSEAALNNVQISVQADGYDSKVEEVDFRNQTLLQHTMRLTQKTFEYRFLIHSKDLDGYLELEQITTHKELQKSPIEGYVPRTGEVFQDKKTYLEYAPYNKAFLIRALIAFLVAFVLGVASGAWAWNSFIGNSLREKLSTSQSNETVTKIPKNDTKTNGRSTKATGNSGTSGEQYTKGGAKSTLGDIDEVIAYLDGNNVWNHSEMDRFPEIRGLWDALNNRKFDEILQYENILTSSTRFMKVIKAVKDNANKTFSGTYTQRSNDYNITINSEGNVKGYIKALYDAPSTSNNTNWTSGTSTDGNGNGIDNQNEW